MADLDDADLIERCQRGDFEAFTALYTRHSPRALRTAYLITQRLPEAEDAVQEAFIQVWRRIAGLRTTQSFHAWFYRTLVNAVNRMHRKGRNVSFLSFSTQQHDKPDPDLPLPDDHLIRDEESQRLHEVLADLPYTHRAAVALRYLTGLSEADVALALEIPVGTVKSGLHHARQQLHRLLASDDADEAPGHEQGRLPEGRGT